MRVNYIRHGMTAANETTGICGRRIDWPLSENGRRAILDLTAEGIYPRDPGACYASRLRRTQETMHLIYPQACCQPTGLLDERDLGFIEYERDIAAARRWRANLVDENGVERPEAYPGGENFQQFSARVLRDLNALLELAHSRDQDCITICGHGSYLRQVGISFAVNSYINVRPIVKNGRGFVFQADRESPDRFRLQIAGFIGGAQISDILEPPPAVK